MKKSSGCLWMLAGFGLCLGLMFIVAVFAIGALGMRNPVRPSVPKFEETVVADAASKSDEKNKIALIHLRGIISGAEPGTLGQTMVDDLKMQLQQAATDEDVKAVVLHVDSPGGEVTASDVIYNAVKKVRDGGYGPNTKKPVVVYMGSLAASGGFYVACGGDYVIANDTTLTGSIGVIMQSLNYQGLMGKVGLETVTFKSGKFKDMLSGSREITPEEKEYIQKMIMQTYSQFVGIVARERKLDEQGLRNGVADGRVISGKDALDAKLIDGLGYIEDAYKKAMELGKVSGGTVITYESPFKLGRIFRLLGKSEATTNVEVNVMKSLTPKLEAGRLYYLPDSFAP